MSDQATENNDNDDDDDDVPVIGEAYLGAGIVTKIDSKTSETPNGLIWNRKSITTNIGAVFTVDHYVEKEKEKKAIPSKEKKEIPYKPDRTGGAGATTTTTTSSQTQQQQPQQPEPIQAAAAAAEEPTTTTAPAATEAEAAPKVTAGSSSSVPLTITVYSKNDPDLPPPPPPGTSAPEPVRGIWSFGDGKSKNDDDKEEPDEDAFWKPQQVLLYRPGLETIPEEESLPSGVWGYAEDQEGNNSSFNSSRENMVSDDPDDWHPKGLTLVVPPREKVPANFVAAGRYTYKPGSVDEWPPPVDTIKKRLYGVGKLQIPNCFDKNDGKLPITVLPKYKISAVTKSTGDDGATPPKAVKRGVTFAPPVGQWSYPEGQEENDDHFLPVEVDLYWGDEKPAGSVSLGGMSSDDGSLVSFGVWGSTSGSVDLNDPEWEPEMSMVFPPGIEPDPEIAIQGRWAYRMNQNTKLEWPPAATTTALVFPSKDAPAIEPGKSQGVWEFKGEDRNDANEDEWDPVEVDILGDDDSLGENEEDEDGTSGPRTHGLWGIKHGAEPNRNWSWQPRDIVFFPPDVKPGDDTWVQGRWAMKNKGVGKLKNTWPPQSASMNKTRTVGKMKSSQWSKNAWVYPAQTVPPRKNDTTSGVWRFPGGVEPKDSSKWKPQQVDLYGPSDKMDDTKPNGKWGVDTNAPDTSDSHFEPEDVWFYPPGQTPEKQCSVQGRWSFQKSKLDVGAWPPPNASPGVHARKSVSVGKLKIPGAFESEASPQVRRQRRSTGVDPSKLPSLFSSGNV